MHGASENGKRQGQVLLDHDARVGINITWEGHEFAENAKDSGIWSQAKEKAGSVSLSIISDLLKAIIASKIAGA